MSEIPPILLLLLSNLFRFFHLIEIECIFGDDNCIRKCIHSLHFSHSTRTSAGIRSTLPSRIQSRFQAHKAKCLSTIPTVHMFACLHVSNQLLAHWTCSNGGNISLFTNCFLLCHL